MSPCETSEYPSAFAGAVAGEEDDVGGEGRIWNESERSSSGSRESSRRFEGVSSWAREDCIAAGKCEKKLWGKGDRRAAENGGQVTTLRLTCHRHELGRKMATTLDTRPSFAHVEFTIVRIRLGQLEAAADPVSDLQEPFIKNELRVKLDADSQLCREHLESPPCPRGTACPLRHAAPSPLNFLPPTPLPSSAHARTVCKHWLRGLCKKGNSCEFMHEYNLRKMPECWFFAKYGFCSKERKSVV